MPGTQDPTAPVASAAAEGVTRRSALRLAGAAAAAGVVADAVLGDRLAGTPLGRLTGARTARANEPFTVPLRFPPVRTGDSITLTARPAKVPVLDGPPTVMWTFDGTFPGPTIRRPSGRRTRLTVRHRLPKEAGSLTIHHHGGHSASAEDGLPGRNEIPVGGSRTYTYDLREDGKPERGALQWYHDHSHYRTSINAWRGLIGMVVLDDPAEKALRLPGGAQELLLTIGDRTFDDDNQLVDPFVRYDETSGPGAGAGLPPNDDVFGARYLVNGVPEPFHVVEPRRYRLRILNSAVFRIYNLALSDGATMQLVGTESGLLPAPVPVTQVLVGPGERVDLVVDFAGKAGGEIRLVSVPRNDPSQAPRTAPAIAELLEFRVAKRLSGRDTSRVPATLRPLPDWVADLPSTPTRVWAFTLGVDTQARTAWTINGLAFDHERVDARPELGSTETWLLLNATTTSHYVHLHDVDWVVLERNGAAPLATEAGLKETFRVDPGEVVLVGTKFTDHLGPYMLHCHMLQHEDHGMMTTFEVVPPGAGDVAARAAATLPLSLEDVLARDLPDARVRRHVAQCLAEARDGRPAPAWVIDQCQDVVVAASRHPHHTG